MLSLNSITPAKIVIAVESSIRFASHNSCNEISTSPRYIAFAVINNAYPSVEIPDRFKLLKLTEYPVNALRARFHKNLSADNKKTAAIYSLRLRYGFLTFAVINSVNVFLCQALLNFIFIIYLTSIFPELRSAVGPEYFRIFFRLFF